MQYAGEDRESQFIHASNNIKESYIAVGGSGCLNYRFYQKIKPFDSGRQPHQITPGGPFVFTNMTGWVFFLYGILFKSRQNTRQALRIKGRVKNTRSHVYCCKSKSNLRAFR